MNFKERVIKIVSEIPKGKVTTYGTVAIMAGLPGSARLVGGILHANGEKLNLPWQRVVNRHGFISIRSLEYPKEAQKALLLQEGVEVSKGFIVNLEKYGWENYG